jgi:hypothetical protein
LIYPHSPGTILPYHDEDDFSERGRSKEHGFRKLSTNATQITVAE